MRSLPLDIAREGARRLLQCALETEIEEHVSRYTDLLTGEQRHAVVRNGYAPKRTVFTGVAPGEIQRPRVDERKASEVDATHERFSSGVLPRFLRKTPTIEGVVATLYLKGVSTNDFEMALKSIYGPRGSGRRHQ